MALLASRFENVTVSFPFRVDSEFLLNSEFVLMQLLSCFFDLCTSIQGGKSSASLFRVTQHADTLGSPELVAVKHTYLDFNVTRLAGNHTHVPGLRTHSVNTALVKKQSVRGKGCN